MKERILNKLQKLKEKLFGEDMQKWEQIKIWLIGIAVFIGVVGAIFGLRAIVNMQKQEDPTTAPTVSTTVPTVPTTVPTEPTTVPTQPMEPTNPTEPTVPTTAPTEPPHMHTWADATCTTPMTCTECGVTEGEALGHTWQNATCTNPKTCAVCGATEGELLAHAWDDGVVLKEATESEDGQMLYTCTVCGETKTQIVPSLGHAHAYTDVVVTNPTCTEKGYTTHTCRCGDSYTDSETPALGHDWKAATCVSAKTCQTCGATDGAAKGHKWTEATCTAPKTCSVCGTKDGTALGHNYSKVVTAPTCTAQGYTTYTCTRCEDAHISDYVNALGHRYADATCTTPKTCTACGHTNGAALGHVWDNGVGIREATEDADGEKLFTCKNCGDTMTQIIPALDHVHSYSAVVTAPTCTEKGYTTHTCRCGDSYTDSEKAALGHDWIEATCVNAKTCERCGTTEGAALGHHWTAATCTAAKTCSVCGTKEGTALGHMYLTDVTKPTCTEQGYTTYTCSRCGDQYRSDIVAALGHDYADATCTEPQICNRCGKTAGNALGHSYGSWKTVSEATCTQKGQEKRNCVRCDHYETRSVNAKGHSYVGNTVKPTCTEQGYTVYTCEVCDNSYKSSYVDALGHAWLEATCWAAKTCDRCGATEGQPAAHVEGPERIENYSRPDPCMSYGSYDVVVYCEVCGVELSRKEYFSLPNGHSWTEATCTEPKICLTCGRTEGDALGHDWLDATCLTLKTCNRCGITEGTLAEHIEGMERVENQIEPIGCLEYGSYDVVVYCETCGVELRREQIVTLPKGHNWADATCTEPKTCLRCGQTEGDALDHDYDSVVTEPTYEAQGYTTYTCKRCGHSYVGNYTDPITALYENGTLVFRTDGVAYLYGDNDEVIATYTGWDTEIYTDSNQAPWYTDRNAVKVVIIEDGVTPISTAYWFYEHAFLRSVTVGNGVTSIGDFAIAYCYYLSSITIPDSVTSIGDLAFSGCRSLTSITIPDGVTSIGYAAFHGCSSLTSITIPDSVTSIGSYAFSNCSSLTSITVAAGNAVYLSAGNCIIETESKTLIAGCNNSMIPDDGSVTSIGEAAFFGCSGLTSITIPNSVTSIGGSAFSGCSSLTSITIPDSVTSIGGYAFSGCSYLTSITIPNSVTSIGGYAFDYCSSLTSITIPDSVTSIGYAAFKDCSSLTSITVAAGNAVYQSAGNCIIETESKTLIAGCKNSVIPDDGSVTSIGEGAFSNCSGLTSITIPDGVTSIGSYAFDGCSSLTSITIPDGVTSIGSYAFDGCSSLTSIAIPAGVTSIGSYAFDGCSSLTSIAIPAGVTSIGSSAFRDCSSLTSIIFEGTMEQWNAIYKGNSWNYNVPATEVVCSDGKVTLS